MDDKVLEAGQTTFKYTGHFWIGYGGSKATLCEEYAWPLTAEKFAPVIPRIAAAVARAHPGRQRPSRGWLLSEDNEPAIATSKLDHIYSRYRLRPYKIPGGSGDLRCVESLWDDIRERLYRGDPGYSETRSEWVARVKRTVFATAAERLTNLTEGMTTRVNLCVAREGRRIGKCAAPDVAQLCIIIVCIGRWLYVVQYARLFHRHFHRLLIVVDNSEKNTYFSDFDRYRFSELPYGSERVAQ